MWKSWNVLVLALKYISLYLYLYLSTILKSVMYLYLYLSIFVKVLVLYLSTFQSTLPQPWCQCIYQSIYQSCVVMPIQINLADLWHWFGSGGWRNQSIRAVYYSDRETWGRDFSIFHICWKCNHYWVENLSRCFGRCDKYILCVRHHIP